MSLTPLRRLPSAALVLLVALIALGASATAASAAYEVDVAAAQPTSTEAGAFADFDLSVGFPRDSTPQSLTINLPKGQLGVLSSAAVCPEATFQADNCAANTSIGSVSVIVHTTVIGNLTAPGTIYRVPTQGTEVGRIGIAVRPPLGDKMFLEGTMRVRASDYGIVAQVDDMPKKANLTVFGAKIPLDITIENMHMTLWGHVGQNTTTGFFFNPAECILATTTVSSVAYDGSTASDAASYTPTNCAGVPFSPTLAFTPNPSPASAAAPFTVDVGVPFSPTAAKMGAPIRTAQVVLPPGVQLTGASNSDGKLVACTDAQFSLTTMAPASCPAGSKVGSVVLDSPLVGQISGDVFLALPTTGSPDLIRLFFVAAQGTAADALRIKLLAHVTIDESTGIMTATLNDLPAQPVKSLKMSFRDGTAPGTRQPRLCGTYNGSSVLTPFSSTTTATKTAGYVVGTNCPAAGRFRPTIGMTTSPSTAGAATTGTTTIDLPVGDEPMTKVKVSLPPGMLAVIKGQDRCTLAQVTADSCPAATQVGTVASLVGQTTVPGQFNGTVSLTDAPNSDSIVGLYIRVPVQVGPIVVDTLKIQAGLSLRSDYGVDVVSSIPETLRGLQLDQQRLQLVFNKANFLMNPPTCTGNTLTGAFTSSLNTAATSTSSVAVTGCSSMKFQPTVAFSSSTGSATAASALTTTVTIPASTPGNEQSPAKKIAVTLPDGVSLSPSAGTMTGGLQGCTDAQFHKTDFADPSCPVGSAIGTTVIQTPAVGRLAGSAYLGTAVAGHTARIFIDAKSDDFGAKARVKLEGFVDVDPATGKTVATFDGLPPVGFTSFALTMGNTGVPVLAMPRVCGTTTGSAVATPFGGTAATVTGSLIINQNCPSATQFGPGVNLALAPSDAGAAGKLTTTITVPSGDQELSKVKLNLPEGLTAKLKGAARCTIAAAQTDACPAATELGTVSAKVGVASAPFTQTGKVYLTDGRNGNVAGMAIVLPAVVGPIDLGKIITIADVQLHSPDLALQVTADVPTDVKGVRLDLRELKLAITKDDFLVNPSSCGVLNGTAAFTSKGGRTASANGTITVPASSCSAQTFDPQLAFSASNPKPGEASDFTTTVTLANGPGAESPFKSVAIRLPAGMSLSASANAKGDLAGCTDAQFHQDDLTVANTCPTGSAIGTASFDTDLVGPLTGKAYLAGATSGNLARVFIETTASEIPNVTVRLIGEVKVDASTGATDAVFSSVPAIPVTKFAVTFRGGDSPTLALPRLCGSGAAAGSGTFAPVNGGATVNRPASLALTTSGCPDPSAFAPTVALTRSNTAAGKTMTFGTQVDVPAKSQELSSLKLALPAGLLGTISSIPACTQAAADAGTCGADSQIGIVSAQVGVASAPYTVNGSAYLVKGDDHVIARLAIVLPAKVGPIDLGNVITFADLKLRGDYGLDISAPSIPTTVKGVRLDLHQFKLTINKPGFMVNPVVCGDVAAPSTVGSAQGGSVDRSQTLTTDGCDALKLDASLGYGADPASPATASAVTTSIKASAPSGSPLDAMKNVSVVLPEGVSLSPSAGARGDLAECTADQFGASDITVDAACPAGSKVGTVAISSPMVGNLSGDVYLGAKSGGDFSGVFFQAKAPDYPSLRVKIAGTLNVDETTGRLTAAFNDLPQVQVSSIDLTLRGGDAPVLSLPRTCGDFASTATIARHGGGSSSAAGTLSLNVDCPDPNAFAPTVGVSTSTTQAAANTALTTDIKVPARQQELQSLALTMPRGLLGRLTVAAQCPLDQAAAGACGDDSLVGSVVAKVGAASAPFTVNGRVYMTAGSGDAIAGLAFVLPAKVGPIDLGNVVTLSKLKIEGNDLQLKIVADAIPTRVKGIPLSISDLAITIDKPGVVLNASNCALRSADASFGSAQGGSASSSSPYQATGCASLNWKPSMSLQLTGPESDMKVKGHPTITTVIEQAEGQGNLRTADVFLPKGVGTDLTNLNARTCESAAAASAGTCAPNTQIGSANIVTSALPKPLNAGIYLVRIPGQSLPGMAIRVRDQISFDIVGITKSSDGRIRVTFDGLPDTPISKMSLVFEGGANGPIQLGGLVCGQSGVQTDASLTAQHGTNVKLALPINCNGVITPLNTTTTIGKTQAAAQLTVRPTGKKKGYTLVVRNPTGIKTLTFTMPKGFSYTKAAKKAIKARLTGGGKNAKVAVSIKGRKLTVKITAKKKTGAKLTTVTRIVVTVPPKAAKFTAAYAKKLKSKKSQKAFKAPLAITDATSAKVSPSSTVKFAKK
jgi:hypothetical protein